MTATKSWPFGTDAKQDDPLTALRIPVVGSFNPEWRYVAAYLGTNADTGSTWDPPWPFASAERPTDAEAQMLASFLLEHRNYWFSNQGYTREMDKRPLDIDSGWNTTVFIKYGADDWGYRRCSWIYGHTFVPSSPNSRGTKYAHAKHPGPLPLERVMDLVHTVGSDEPMAHWTAWKAAHPEIFPAEEATR
ncbi:hypothetical protein OG601_46910 [Streptomyces sp. NBC_01239]|uniref:hypothetical protein n=1 Tax=Streptomyces sp. NBC_01239 TaxID=2903792 RepID=UPI00224E4146|nr:hypothetical protein [Streptomyces sp. NBC_01239]MCX4809078.1 hypothetical protein [Streptomyces sp. NBC_01239]MCX4818105.1 hypothetical protein [Streptomyces sp. NBC_01239]